MKKINKITLKIEIDEDPDVSYIGEIADSQTARKQALVEELMKNNV